jgi:photosystem II stability/assembly factor-like uncharacterized protein
MRSPKSLRCGKLALVASLITSVVVAQSSSSPKSQAHKLPAAVPGKGEHPKYKGIFEPVNYSGDINLKDVFFISGDDGWVVGDDSTILHTTDGKTWKAEVGGDPSNKQPQIKLVRALDTHHAWAIEDTPERVLATTDGENWSELGDSPRGVVDLIFTSAQHGILLANGSKEYYRGGVFLTQDAGKRWSPQMECKITTTVQGLAHNDECWFIRLQVLSPKSLYALAADNSDSLALFHSADEGRTWKYNVLPFKGNREHDFFFADDNNGVIVFHGDGKTYVTEDGGQNWHMLLATKLASQIHFADAEVGWTLGGTRMYCCAAQVNYTVDGGRHWRASADIKFPPNTPDDYRFSFPRRDRAYVIGPHGMIYRYRIVPWEYTAPNILPAPLMPRPPEKVPAAP